MEHAGSPIFEQRFQNDPTRCEFFLHPRMTADGVRGGRFVGTEFRPGFGGRKHEINQLFRCPACGYTYKRPRTVSEAGRLGAVEIDDPRVRQTITMTPEAIRYLYPEFNERFGGKKPGMEIFQVPDNLESGR